MMIPQLQTILSKEKKLAIGLMSGTSLDGIDAAVVEILHSGKYLEVSLIEYITLEYTGQERKRILRLCHPSTSSVNDICETNVYLGEKFAEASLAVMQRTGLSAHEIDFISSHGQTIYHLPEKYATLQIGELAVIAERTGCLTVGDFRPSDMAAGGQGAPLVPYVDYVLFRHEKKGRILLNIGGISNLTAIKAGARPDEIMAFDTGPGNVLIDALVHIGSKGSMTYDIDGRIAAKGHIHQRWIDSLLKDDPFIRQRPPKSTGREHYTIERAEQIWSDGISHHFSFEDIVASITAFTAQAIQVNIKQFIQSEYEIDEVLVSGGGASNPILMKNLQAGLKQKVIPLEEAGFSSEAKEAISFAILGNEFLHGHSNHLPSATGAGKRVVMGKLVLPPIHEQMNP